MKSFYLLMMWCITIVAAMGRPLTRLMPADCSVIINDTSYRIIQSEANTYGYEILVDKKLLIRQKNIPGLAGNTGFSTKTAAAKVARLVILKLQQGTMPPTITHMELNKLGIKL